jgi:DNA-binding transcriptional MocR family regulator
MSTGSTTLQAQYEELKARGLALDLTRGKPSPEQLDLSSQLLSIDLAHDFRDESGTDLRNYGGFDGILELREIFGELLGVPAAQLLAGNNASLGFMHDIITHALLHGVPGSERPWWDDDVAFLCPVPGYDRHFAILEALGVRMIAVPPTADGGLDVASIASYLGDPAVRGMWIVPMYSNPTGVTLDEATARELVSLPAAAPDFRLFWDNAYAVHHLTDDEPEPIDILGIAAEADNPDRPFVFGSTSKISHAGSGVSFLAASATNLDWYRKHGSVQSIGPDKLNQQRHLRFFGDAEGVRKHMRAHREILAPKFAAVERILTDRLTGHARWSHPRGGYFVTLEAPEGTATRAVELAKAAGIAVTPAGSPYPYGEDPRDSVIRLAPTMPSLADVEAAIDGLCTCVLLAEEERGALPA